MEMKLFEIRDRATCISALAIRPGVPFANLSEEIASNEREEERLAQYRYHLGRCGYPWQPPGSLTAEFRPVLLGGLNGRQPFYVDPYDWPGGARTMPIAHQYIEQNWDRLVDGQVIDVRHIEGEQPEPAQPDRLTAAHIIAGGGQ